MSQDYSAVRVTERQPSRFSLIEIDLFLYYHLVQSPSWGFYWLVKSEQKGGEDVEKGDSSFDHTPEEALKSIFKILNTQLQHNILSSAAQI
ncbi:hypothetical protein SCA6_006051 [Theobroma cacao]